MGTELEPTTSTAALQSARPAPQASVEPTLTMPPVPTPQAAVELEMPPRPEKPSLTTAPAPKARVAATTSTEVTQATEEKSLWQRATESVSSLTESAKQTFSSVVVEPLKQAANFVTEKGGELLSSASVKLQQAGNFVVEKASNFVSGAKELINDYVVQPIKDGLNFLANQATNLWSGVQESFSNTFGGIVDSLASAFGFGKSPSDYAAKTNYSTDDFTAVNAVTGISLAAWTAHALEKMHAKREYLLDFLVGKPEEQSFYYVAPSKNELTDLGSPEAIAQAEANKREARELALTLPESIRLASLDGEVVSREDLLRMISREGETPNGTARQMIVRLQNAVLTRSLETKDPFSLDEEKNDLSKLA